VSALRLLPRERVLAWATDALGQWYVGTDLAIHLPVGGGGYRRLGWEDVQRADWDRDSERLSIVEVADWGEPEPTSDFEVAEPGRLLELLRERVTNTVVCTVYARVRGSAGLSVVGRRSPSRDTPGSTRRTRPLPRWLSRRWRRHAARWRGCRAGREAPPDGLEPSTTRLTAECSAN